MTEENRKRLEAYVKAASINAPAKVKAWLEYLKTLSEEEQEKEIDRAIFDRGFKRFEQRATTFGGIGNIRYSKELAKMVKEYKNGR